jgi:hypothetical protein
MKQGKLSLKNVNHGGVIASFSSYADAMVTHANGVAQRHMKVES